MSEPTKACNLFASEIEMLIEHHGKNIAEDVSGRLDRMNYLHKRLKAFNDPVSFGEALASNVGAAGWGSNNG